MTSPIDCTACLRPIEDEHVFFILDTGANVCVRCMDALGRKHAALWKECPHSWHDAYDHVARAEVTE